jgi:protein SCO1/2
MRVDWKPWCLAGLLVLLSLGRSVCANELTHVDPDVIELAPFPRGGDFELTGSEGKIRLADLRGKIVLLYFGYTHCPDICPTSMTTLQQAVVMLPKAERDRVVVLFISVDPKRDTPQHLKNYAGYFGKHFLGLTAEQIYLDDLAGRYGAQYHLVSSADKSQSYAVEHSSAIHVVDTSGRLRAIFRHTIHPHKLAAGIHYLLTRTDTSSGP